MDLCGGEGGGVYARRGGINCGSAAWVVCGYFYAWCVVVAAITYRRNKLSENAENGGELSERVPEKCILFGLTVTGPGIVNQHGLQNAARSMCTIYGTIKTRKKPLTCD